ncbi:MAG: hydroxyacid dehydrogenase [Solobacterium sp.]|nr:hydroxyacid dehydrogenase [Solobacterium sp.]
MKIAILESLGITEEKLNELKEPFEKEGHSFVVYNRTNDEEVLKDEVKDVDVAIIANMPFSSDVIAASNQLKFIDVAFTGVDHVGLEVAKEKDIKVSNASGYSNEAVSELAVGMIIAKYRYLREVEDLCRSGKTKENNVGLEIKGKTVGIIGLGKIGRRSAELLDAFGANVIACNSRLIEDCPPYVVERPMDDLLQESDIVILHCPLNESTRNLINMDKIKRMKKSALLVNVARGPIINTKDLQEALEKGIIAGACIDVFDQEPPLSKEEPLLSTPNTLVTPHVAFATQESMVLRAEIVFDNLRAWLDGEQQNIIL